MITDKMNALYPPESQRMDVVGHLDELRRRILFCLAVFAVLTGILFSQGYLIMAFLQAPAHGIITDFIFVDPTEAFGAYFKVVLLAAFAATFPVVLYELWAFLAPALSAPVRRAIRAWILLALVCFYGGMAFAYGVLLPAAVNFLISFGAGIARPAITISGYISFATVLLLIGAVVFQIPVVAGILAEAGLVDARKLAAGRRYALLLILIMAAIVTPTQDVFNMMLCAGPMIALYEVGIVMAWLVGRRKAKTSG